MDGNRGDCAGNRIAGGAGCGLDGLKPFSGAAEEPCRPHSNQQFKQGDDVLGQRLAKAEDTNAQLQGELSVVTDKMKLTETELSRARLQSKKIKEEDDEGTDRSPEQRHWRSWLPRPVLTMSTSLART